MPCGKEITNEPLLGGLDLRNQRGTGRQQDFELLLNVDGSAEDGYFRGSGWRRYLYDQLCPGGTIITPPPSFAIWSGRVGLDAAGTWITDESSLLAPQFLFWGGLEQSKLATVTQDTPAGNFAFTTPDGAALTVTYSDSIVVQSGPWSLPLSIQQFDDTALGRPLSVDIQYTTLLRTAPAVENLDGGAQTVTIGATGTVDFSYPSTDVLDSLPSTATVNVPLLAYDGVTDDAETSGFTQSPSIAHNETLSTTLTSSSPEWPDLIGQTSAVFGAAGSVSPIGSSSPGPTNLDLHFGENGVGAQMDLTWHYRPFVGYWIYLIDDLAQWHPTSFKLLSDDSNLPMASLADLGGPAVNRGEINGFGYEVVQDFGSGVFKLFRSKFQLTDGSDDTVVVTGTSPGPTTSTTPGSYGNQDLHDQMWQSRQVVDISPEVVLANPSAGSSPCLEWKIRLKANRYAVRIGHLYLRLEYQSGAGNGFKEVDIVVAMTTAVWLTFALPGDAHDIHITRLSGLIDSKFTQTATTIDCGASTIIESGDDACSPYLPYERSEISLLKSVTSSSKKRRLFAGTRDTLFVNDDLAGNWRVIADGLGGECGAEDKDTSLSFKVETLGDIAIFTNGLDLVLEFQLNDPPLGALQWSADYVADLQALRITSAKVIGKYQGFILLADITQDGRSKPGTIIWSDYNDARSWVPGGNSAAGFQDFGRGEIVLAIEPIGGSLRVYTSQAIYDGRLVDGPAIFAFDEIHRFEDDEASVLRYPNTLVNVGNVHYYLGVDSIYSTTVYDRAPQRVEWMYVAAGAIFVGLPAVVVQGLPDLASYGPVDKGRCRLPVGGFDALHGAVWFSWPTTTQGSNDLTLVLWPRYHKASLINQGFTAFTNHRPDRMMTLRDWEDRQGICSANDQLLPKEGAACDAGNEMVAYPYLYNATESTALPMDPASAIAAMCGQCLEDLCADCDADSRFLMAITGDDISIKEYTGCGVREALTGHIVQPFPALSVGCYENRGYLSVLQRRLFRYGTTNDKECSGMKLNVSSDGLTMMVGQIGMTDCADTTRWSLPFTRQVCDSNLTVITDPLASGARFKDGQYFPFYERGQFVTCRIYVTGLDGCFRISASTLKLMEVC